MSLVFTASQSSAESLLAERLSSQEQNGEDADGEKPVHYTIEQITEIVCGDKPFRKIFALIVVINKLAGIKEFIDDGVSDECLPLLRVSRPDSENTFQLSHSRISTRPIRQIGYFSDWDAIDIWTFEEWQWTTISPILKRGSRRNIKHLILRDDETKYLSRLQRTADIALGLKSSKGDLVLCSRFTFTRPTITFVIMSGDGHPHLSSLLRTYEQFRRFYLIFPWTEADLQRYLEKINPNPPIDYPSVNPASDANWVTSQAQSHGRYRDVKLQNVLWFCDPDNIGDRGVLNIADFGLAEFETSPTRFHRRLSHITFSSPYQPPELNTRESFVGGWCLVKSFEEVRATTYLAHYVKAINGTFFTIVGGGPDGSDMALVKPAVTKVRLAGPLVDLGRIASVPHELPERHRDDFGTHREVRWGMTEGPNPAWFPTERALEPCFLSLTENSNDHFELSTSVRFSVHSTSLDLDHRTLLHQTFQIAVA
ncbi:hypothetical protein LA080_006014 [Diaporthe eres]|nr:hypothetical protein LA080_006014 [Diaporthe eres]